MTSAKLMPAQCWEEARAACLECLRCFLLNCSEAWDDESRRTSGKGQLRATGANNPEGCVLARARGQGSHVDNWVDVVNKRLRAQLAWGRECGGGGDESVTDQCR